MSNSAKYYLRSGLLAVNGMLCSGSIYQAFLMRSGVSDAQIGTLTSIAFILQSIAMLACAGLIDHLSDKGILSSTAWLLLPNLLFPITLLIINLKSGMVSGQQVFILLLPLTILLNLFAGYSGILGYKLPYLLIPMRQYARLCSSESIINGIVSFLTGFCVTLMINRLSYSKAMTIGYTLAACCTLVAIGLSFAFHPLKSWQQQAEKKTKALSFGEVFGLPSFKQLLFPNIARGLASGVIAMLIVIGARELAFNEGQSAMIANVIVAASICGGLLFRVSSSRISSAALCLSGSIVMLFSCVGMLLLHSYAVFLACAFLVMTGQSVVNNSIPVMLTLFVPYNHIGQYTSYRMLLTTGASSLASLLVGFLLGNIPAFLLMLAAGLLQAYCGASYFCFYRNLHSYSSL